MENDIEMLKTKLQQASAVITYLLRHGDDMGSEGQRAAEYFSGSAFDPGFLPWPSVAEEGIRPKDLNAANDD